MKIDLKYKLKKLKNDKIDKIVALENISMKTDTTFPLTKEEFIELFKNGYITYGYEDDDGTLISKVGFTKTSDKKFELDICVHPDFQRKGIGTKIIQQSIKRVLSKNNNLNIFLRVHPQNPSLRLYKRLKFKARRNNDGSYKINITKHGPRITMDYINQNNI